MKTKRKAKKNYILSIKQDLVEGTIAKRDEEMMLSKFVEVIVNIIRRGVKF